jgi:MFS family permease
MVVRFALAGSVVRRRGARALLVGSLALVAFGALGFVLGDSLAIYFAARLLMGLGSGGIWIGVTFDTLERWPGQEYLCMSRIFAAYSVGGLIGPTLGAFGGIRGPFLAYLALLLAALPLVLLVREPQARREFAADRAVLRTRGFRVASAAILFAVLALGVLDGVLPLHVAERLSQAQIGGLYVGASLIVAVSAAAAGGMRPRPLVFAAVLLAVAGTSLAGMAADVPLWLLALALALAAVGIGLANTGSLGLLVDAVPVQRIVTGMVVWSQIGIVGYLLGPLAGGIVADSLGYTFVGTVSALAGLLVVALLRTPPLAGDPPAPGRRKRHLTPGRARDQQCTPKSAGTLEVGESPSGSDERLADAGQAVVGESVVDPGRPLLALQQTGLVEDLEVVADGRLGESERFDEVACAGLTVGARAQEAQHLESGGVGDGLQGSAEALGLVAVEWAVSREGRAAVVGPVRGVCPSGLRCG